MPARTEKEKSCKVLKLPFIVNAETLCTVRARVIAYCKRYVIKACSFVLFLHLFRLLLIF